MNKKMIQLGLFMIVVLGIYGGMNYYVYRNLVGTFGIFEKFSWLLGIGFIFLAVGYLVGRRMEVGAKAAWFSYLGAGWMGVLSIAVTVYFLKDVLALFLPIPKQQLNQVALLWIVLLCLVARVNVIAGPKVKEVAIRHEKMKKSLSLVLLSDIHLGHSSSSKWVGQLVETVNQLKPDAVLIAGDLVDDHFHLVEGFAGQLKGMESRYGTYVVSGNHEHYHNIDDFERFVEAAGMTRLNNQWVALDPAVNLVGIDDLAVAQTGALEKNLDALASNLGPEKFNILMIHQPVGFPYASQKGVDLQLSGHTHGGQLPPLNFLVRLHYRYAYGLKRYQQSYIYTSSGTGTWGPPMRLFSSSEIVKINIEGK